MSKRLQVILDDQELSDIQRMAQTKQMTVAEWVRQALRAARRGESSGDPGRKLQAIQVAARHSFPAADIETMLQEIEVGYTGRRR
jgi:hypothetical protein